MRSFDWLLEFGDLDWPAILLGTVVAMAVGFLWYGPLFGKPWSRASGVSMDRMPQPGKLVLTAVYVLVFNLGIAYLGVADEYEHALVTAIIVGILLIGPALFGGTIWGKRSQTAFLIDVAHWVVIALVGGLVQGLVA